MPHFLDSSKGALGLGQRRQDWIQRHTYLSFKHKVNIRFKCCSQSLSCP